MNYYAVRVGRNPGIYKTWDECKKETMGFKGASFKKFSSLEDAKAFIKEVEEEKREEAEKDELIVYVDGSYRNSDKSHSYGVYMFNDEEEYCFSKRFFKDSDMRNVSEKLRAPWRPWSMQNLLEREKFIFITITKV